MMLRFRPLDWRLHQTDPLPVLGQYSVGGIEPPPAHKLLEQLCYVAGLPQHQLLFPHLLLLQRQLNKNYFNVTKIRKHIQYVEALSFFQTIANKCIENT
jgi:hypothetical protein